MKQLAVILPVYNEEEIISKVIEQWTNVLEKLEIDFVIFAYNDGSVDNSLEILEQIARENPKLTVKNKKNSGHGATVLQGYRECSYDFEWVFQTDSDNELGTGGFVDMWKKRANYDFLIGKRIYKKRNLSRKLISKIAEILVKVLFGQGVLDVNCPYRLMKTEKFKELFEKIPQDTFAPNIIISGFVNKNKLVYFELPVEWHERTTGSVSVSKLKLFKSACKAFVQTIAFVTKN